MERNYALGKEVIFDTLKCEIFSDKKVVSLGSRDGAILKLLCEQCNKIVLKEEIHEQVWGKVLVSETSLTKSISNLRKYLALFDGVTCEIKTVPKEGYMLITEEPFSDLLWVDLPPAMEVKNVISSERKLIEMPIPCVIDKAGFSLENINDQESFIDFFIQDRGYLMVFIIILSALVASLFSLIFMIFWL
ncbi:transcriptional regulator [Vibrio cholerae]|uniref:winged helix-turn-helix domain-containing protein n=1 Tax=Vibrio cholerae TaxID=666 RepID=UPI00157A3D74|nr:winged helix-turn-helix domain-containing protein [Vibrio cholerae]CAB1261452.1 transcriptional regulator [Vibrio cholerae]